MNPKPHLPIIASPEPRTDDDFSLGCCGVTLCLAVGVLGLLSTSVVAVRLAWPYIA